MSVKESNLELLLIHAVKISYETSDYNVLNQLDALKKVCTERKGKGDGDKQQPSTSH